MQCLMINHILPIYFVPRISAICVLLQVNLSHTKQLEMYCIS